MHNRFALFGTRGLLSSATHTKKSSQKVIHTTTMAASLLEAVFSILVIQVAFFLIRKNLVSCLNFLEFFLISTAVWVLFESKLTIVLFDLIKSSGLFNAKYLVEFSVVNIFRLTTTWTRTSHFL